MCIRDREEILESIREISRDIKLKDLIIANFIPPQYQDKIVKHAHWDEYDAAWSIDAHSLGGNSVRGQRELAAMQQAQMQPAYIPAGTQGARFHFLLLAVAVSAPWLISTSRFDLLETPANQIDQQCCDWIDQIMLSEFRWAVFLQHAIFSILSRGAHYMRTCLMTVLL